MRTVRGGVEQCEDGRQQVTGVEQCEERRNFEGGKYCSIGKLGNQGRDGNTKASLYCSMCRLRC
jgi:hypothetical protein